jgi:hypothetical protein
MKVWDNGDPEGRGLLMFCLGALATAVAVAIIFVAVSAFSVGGEDQPSQESLLSTDRSTDAAATTSGEPSAGTTPAPGTPTTSYLGRCQEVYEAQSDPLRTADVSLAQWEVHVGAMNKLVVGAITLQQAKQFWNQTRVGASQRLEEFATAAARFDQRTARCPDPAGSPDVSPQLTRCHQAVAARNRTLSLATVALATWKMHVHHMNMLRSGEMTPEEATRLWLRNWKQGDREVHAYRDAARAAEGRTCA